MKKLIPILFLPLLFLTSCGSGDAAKTADTYHTFMKAKDYNSITENCLSADAKAITPVRDWLNLFEEVGGLGEIKSIDKVTGFNSSMNNGVTTVTLRYHYKYVGNVELYERIILIRDGGDFEIAGIAWHKDLGELPMPKN